MAAASSLGTLTLSLLAETGGYIGPLDKAERETLRAMKAMGAAVDEFGNYTDKAYKRIAQSAAQLDASYGSMFENMQRQIALYGETSRASAMAFDTQKGHLKSLSDEQKASLVAESRRLDAMESANAAFAQQTAVINALNTTHESLLAGLQKEITLQGDASRAASIRYDLSLGKLKDLDAAKKSELLTELAVIEARENQGRASAQASAAAAQLNKTHNALEDSMLQELALYGEVTRAAQLRYRIEQGDLQDLDSAQSQNLLTLAEQLDSLAGGAEEATGGFRGLRGVALSAGYQIQDVVVQLQAGTSAFMVISQQGSQFLSSFGMWGAAAGAVVAVAGVIGGVLFESLMMAQEAVKDLESNVAELTKEYASLSDAQREVADKGLAEVIADRTKKYEEGTKAIDEQSKALQELKDSGTIDLTFKNAANSALLLGAAVAKIATYGAVDKTDEMWARFSPKQDVLDRTKELTALTAAQAVSLRKLQELKDTTGGTKVVNALNDEVKLLGLQGKALHEATAAQRMYDPAIRASYVSLMLFKDAHKDTTEFEKRKKDLDEERISLELKNAEIHKNIGLMDELSKKLADAKNTRADGTKIGSPAEQAAIAAAEEYNAKLKQKNTLDTEAVALFKQQDKAGKDKILTLQREIDLFGISSKAQQFEYDVRSGLIKLNKDGSAERILQLTAELALKEKIATFAKAKEEVEFAGYDNRKGDIESAKMRYELDNGVLEVNKELTKEYYDQLIANKKLVESKVNAAKVDDYLDNLKHGVEEAKLITGEEKLRYKIMTDQLFVAEGINSAKAQELLATQRTADAQAKQLALTASIKDSLVDALMEGASAGKDIFQNLADTIDGIFQTLVLKPALDVVTDDLAKTLTGLLGSFGTKDSTGKTTGASGALGALGPYGATAVAAVGATVGVWNDMQEKGFEKLTAAYRQGVQATGTVLGESNNKSESIANAIDYLGATASSTLDVNYNMYQALLDIREGISGSAAGFARQGIGAAVAAQGVKVGVTDAGGKGEWGAAALVGGVFGLAVKGVADFVGGDLGGFVNGILGGVSKALYNKKVKITDTGIQILGDSLANMLEQGSLAAVNYAEVKTTKKVLGVKTSVKSRTETSEMDEMFKVQFAQVFESAGVALEEASKTFGVGFDPAQLMIDATKLSLKDLEGDALVKEIESFFSSTLDKWATTVVSGTDALLEFQKVGEGAFETVVRLAAETNTFSQYAELLGLNFKAVGYGAIGVTQDIADMSGGFDKLSSSLGSYYQNFFSDSERTAAGLAQIGESLKTVGIDAVPATREAFRALVEQANLATEAGQKEFALLVGLSGVFAELVPATKGLADSGNAAAEALKIANERYDLEIRQLEALGRSAEALAMTRKKELDSLDESNRQLLLDIYALEDYNRVFSEKLKLELEHLGLMGKASEVQALQRAKELEALDESNRQIQEQIYALEDQAAAAEAATKALKELSDAATSAFDGLSKSIEAEKSRINAIVDNASNAKSALDDAISRERSTITAAHEEKLKQLEEQSKAAQDAAQQMADAEFESRRAIAKAQQDATQDQLKALEASVSGLATLFEDLNSSVFGIAIVTDAVTRSRRRAAEFEIETAIGNAKQGRGIPVDGRIQEALGILGNNPTELYASMEEMAYSTAVTQNKLIELASLTGAQKTTEEQTIELLKAQLSAQELAYNSIEKSTNGAAQASQELINLEKLMFDEDLARLDAMAEDARKQFDKLSGIDTTLLTLNGAQEAFSKALLAADFENAKAQIESLELIEANAKAQLNVLIGIENGIVSVHDALREFVTTIDLAAKAQDANAAGESVSTLLDMYHASLEENKAMREESYNLLQAIRKNGQDTADTLLRMEEEALTV